MSENVKTLGISYVPHILLKHGFLFHICPHYIMRNFILWQWKKLSFGINFCSYLTGSFWNKF